MKLLNVMGTILCQSADPDRSSRPYRASWAQIPAKPLRPRGMNPELTLARRTPHMADTHRLAVTQVQKVVVVDGNAEVLGMLEAVLDAGRYDMVFVESSSNAYTQIKKVIPNLVIVCTRIEHLEAFQLLTMLKLDPETRGIPVLTCTTEYEGQDLESVLSQPADEDEELRFTSRPALSMN
jgi:CheY-like chemotaxis protein